MTSAAQPTRMKGATHVTEPGLCARNATTGARPPHPTHHCRVGRAGSRCRDATNRTGPRDRLGHHAHRLRRGAPPTPSESTSQQRSEASPLLGSVSNRGAPPSSDFSVLGRRSCCTKPPQVLALSPSFRSVLLSEAELLWAPLMRCVSGAGACGEIGGAPKRGAGPGSCFHLLWLWWGIGGGE
jgi:hypothetical protein